MTTPIAATPPPLPGSRPPTWWGRHWKWAVPTMVVVLLALFTAFVFGMILLIGRMMKSAEPYRHAVALARQEPRVVAALGEPVEEGWLPLGNINTNGSGGAANLDITLRGPRGEGHVYVEARREGGLWRYRALSFAGGGVLVELPHDAPAADLARCEP